MPEVREKVEELAARAGLGHLSPRAVLGIAAVAIAVVAWALIRAGSGGAGEQFEFEEAPEQVAEVGPAVSAAEESSATVVVHVAGAVMHPGIVELPDGSRVGEAVQSAGGALGNAALDALNLARVITDGEQVYVPTQDEVAAGTVEVPSAPTQAGGSSAGGLVDINTATQAELEELPGVGPSTATAIIEDRETNGPFSGPEDLMRVSGIGPKKYEALADLIEAR